VHTTQFELFKNVYIEISWKENKNMKENKNLKIIAVALLILSILPFMISATVEVESDSLDLNDPTTSSILWVLKLILFLSGIGVWIVYLIALIMVVLDLWKAKDMSTGWKILWAIISLILGPLGIIIYTFVGRNPEKKK